MGWSLINTIALIPVFNVGYVLGCMAAWYENFKTDFEIVFSCGPFRFVPLVPCGITSV